MKDAQVPAKVFTFIVALIIVLIILAVGYQSYDNYVDNQQKVMEQKFIEKLKAKVREADYGDLIVEHFDVPRSFKEICFVGTSDMDLLPQGFSGSHPLIVDSLQSGADVYIKSSEYISVDLGELTVDDNAFCIDPGNVDLILAIEGLIDSVKICLADESGSCSLSMVQCSSDKDCGSASFVGSRSCKDGSVYQDKEVWTCNDPGTSKSYCSSSLVPTLKEHCSEGCTAGACDLNSPIPGLSDVPISTCEELQNVKIEAGTRYYLTQNIPCMDTNPNLAGSIWKDEKGFNPLASLPDSSIFDGNGYMINDFHIYRPGQNNIGLFTSVHGKVIGLAIINANVAGSHNVGALAGSASGNAEISACRSNGRVFGEQNVGGLLGTLFQNSKITDSYSNADVTGNRDYIGGLIGYIYEDSIAHNIYATGDVQGKEHIGGIFGSATNVQIEDSYAQGKITGESKVGSLIGSTQNVVITGCHATGTINEAPGPLIGQQYNTQIS